MHLLPALYSSFSSIIFFVPLILFFIVSISLPPSLSSSGFFISFLFYYPCILSCLSFLSPIFLSSCFHSLSIFTSLILLSLSFPHFLCPSFPPCLLYIFFLHSFSRHPKLSIICFLSIFLLTCVPLSFRFSLIWFIPSLSFLSLLPPVSV